MIHALQEEVVATVEEVRSLAAGIYPSTLAVAGLAEALRALGRRAGVPVEISTTNTGRWAADIEAAVYFCCSEALQNAAKHAPGSSVSISLSCSPDLVFQVCDDGPGFDSAGAEPGQGLANMHDRLQAAGGALVIVSAPGNGTCVRGRIPFPDRAEGETMLPGGSLQLGLAERRVGRDSAS
jgi:signal transduction histidine kinase